MSLLKRKKCNLNKLCLLHGMNAEKLTSNMNALMGQTRRIQKNTFLYRKGDSAKAVYTVHSGCVKTMAESTYGNEQIVGFHLAGEVLGLDGFSNNRHICNAIALEASSVCVLPLNQLETLCQKLPYLQKQMRCIMSKKIYNDHKLLLLLGKTSTKKRLARFLLNLSMRMEEHEFSLSMSRQDIANYLGMAVETVSRIFASFQIERIIEVNYRYVTILDMPRLEAIADECD